MRKKFLALAVACAVFALAALPAAMAQQTASPQANVNVTGTLQLSMAGAYQTGLYFTAAANDQVTQLTSQAAGETDLVAGTDYMQVTSTQGNVGWDITADATGPFAQDGGSATYDFAETATADDVVLANTATGQDVRYGTLVSGGNGTCTLSTTVGQNATFANDNFESTVTGNPIDVVEFRDDEGNGDLDFCVSYQARILAPLLMTPPTGGFPAGTYTTSITYTVVSEV